MQTLYMIYCKPNCYYTRGVRITNIPLDKYKNISLQKITFFDRTKFIHDLYPAFLNFLKAIKLYYNRCKNPNVILKREIHGYTSLPRFRNILQEVVYS